MSGQEPFVTYLELRESTSEGEAGAGLSHQSKGLVLLHVLELAASGEPRGAVTILHDAGDHGGRYTSIARRLASDGWSIALPDMRGHGRSEGEKGHTNGLNEIVRDLRDVQDHLAYRQPEAPKVIIGQGAGALAALAFASENPGAVSALVLVAPLLEPRFEPPSSGGGLMKLFKKPGPTSAGRTGWTPSQLTSDAAQQRALSGDALCHGFVTLRASEQWQAAAQRYVPSIATLGVRVLVLAGSEDPIVSVERVRALAAPSVEVRVLDGFRHDVFHETRANEAHELVARWLDTTLPR